MSPFSKEGESQKYVEESLITAGDGVNECRRFLKKTEDGRWSYGAGEVVDYLVSEFEAAEEGKVVPSAQAEPEAVEA